MLVPTNHNNRRNAGRSDRKIETGFFQANENEQGKLAMMKIMPHVGGAIGLCRNFGATRNHLSFLERRSVLVPCSWAVFSRGYRIGLSSTMRRVSFGVLP